MQHEFGDDEHYDDEDLLICDDCGSNNIVEDDEGMLSVMFCVDCGAIFEF